MRRDLPELVGDLRETSRLPDLAETVLERIEDASAPGGHCSWWRALSSRPAGPDGPTPVAIA